MAKRVVVPPLLEFRGRLERVDGAMHVCPAGFRRFETSVFRPQGARGHDCRCRKIESVRPMDM
jgi:hypothetical protein